MKILYELRLKFLFSCLMCNNEENLTVIPYSTIIKIFIEKKVIILYGTRCCSKHMNSLDDLTKIHCSFEETEMTGEEATRFLEKVRAEFLKSQAQAESSGK